MLTLGEALDRWYGAMTSLDGVSAESLLGSLSRTLSI
jgi:hypothetical protein